MSADWLLLVVSVGTVLVLSFACSLLEAVLLSVRVSELAERSDAGHRGVRTLLRLKTERLDDAISAILTLNTVAHTAGAALAGAAAGHLFGDAAVGVFSAVFTLLVLLLTEIIPKTLGAVHASRLSGVVGPATAGLTAALAPVLVATRAVTRLIAREKAPGVSRGEVAGLLALATRDGSLASEEFRVMANVLRLREVRVSDVMTPRTVVVARPAATTLAEMASDREAAAYSRIPVHDAAIDDAKGYVLQQDVLRALVRGAAPTTPLRALCREAAVLPETLALPVALRRFLATREHLALVVDEYGGLSGLVTLEDVLETMLGAEIVDEKDAVVDTRVRARNLRDERLARSRPRDD